MAAKGSEVLKEGHLRKQGGRLKIWKTRWFVIRADGIIQYYSSSEKNRMLSQFSLRGLELHVIPNDALDMQNEKFLFELKNASGTRITDNHDVFTFCASSEEERDAWTFVLMKILYRERGGAVFGYSLAETMAVDGKNNYFVPRVVKELVEFIDREGIEIEGIFRLAGRKKFVTKLIDDYDRGRVVNLSEEGVDVHTAASVLKNYLRQLPEPLIPFDRFEEMSTYGSKLSLPLDDMSEVYTLVINGLHTLPQWNYNLLRYLIEFLCRIASKSEVNKMSAKNLAAVHAPNILRMENENAELMATVNMVIVETTLGFLLNSDKLFTREIRLPEELTVHHETTNHLTATAPAAITSSVLSTASTANDETRDSYVADLPRLPSMASRDGSGDGRLESDASSSDCALGTTEEKLTPTSDTLHVMVRELKGMLSTEQAMRQCMEEKLIFVNARVEELQKRNLELERENGALRQRLHDVVAKKGSFV